MVYPREKNLFLVVLGRPVGVGTDRKFPVSSSDRDVKEHSDVKSHVRQDLKFTHMNQHHYWVF